MFSIYIIIYLYHFITFVVYYIVMFYNYIIIYLQHPSLAQKKVVCNLGVMLPQPGRGGAASWRQQSGASSSSSVAKFSVGEDGRRHHGPEVDGGAQPRRDHLDPHGPGVGRVAGQVGGAVGAAGGGCNN